MQMTDPRAGRATACAREARRRGPKQRRGSQAEAIPRREKRERNLDSELRVDLERHADVGNPNLAGQSWPVGSHQAGFGQPESDGRDRKSTRLNSSHANISYAVFCLKKKKTKYRRT